ncbi:MAG: HAD-IC family P-type ATPase [Chloroflexi bacterium]|nr:HAD-IC family P-type ATPase [Chloroflexota bacterium]
MTPTREPAIPREPVLVASRVGVPPVVAGQGVPELPADLPSTPDTGLTHEEAVERRARGLGNDTRIPSGRTYREILRDNVLQPVNILLALICVVLVALGLIGDAGVTIVLVAINVVVGLVQEVRAKRSLDRLSVLTRPTASVIRGGEERALDALEVVLGDLLVVRRGDQLLLDGRVTEGRFQADESLLTGESDRIPKTPGSEVLSGSFCVDGEARYVATRVGAESFANQLTAGARAFRGERTPLQQDVMRILRGMSVLVLIAAIPVLVGLYLRTGSLPPIETARAAAVLVALIPQGLVVMVTVAYALAIVRLAGQRALIQRANAVESMSRVSVLCLDKTGTLTTPEIEVADVHPVGDEADLARWLGAFVCSVSLRNRTSDAIAERFPVGGALEVIEEVPFSSELRWSALVARDATGPCLLVLGAPEVLAAHLVAGDHAALDRLVAEQAALGLRVVLFCRRPGHPGALLPEDDTTAAARLPDDLEPLGVVVLRERIRPDARSTLARFADAGVSLKLISGDNPVTVGALARQVGLHLDGAVVSGLDLQDLDDVALGDAVRDGSVFGRVPPSLKARLVGALRTDGEWVAMVGDGVNDILSLKQANLGIAMQSGSPATRAVADIVLLEDSFAALPEAVIEGQRIIAGMRDSLVLFLTRVVYMALAILVTASVGLAMPVDPKHNTVVALLTVGIPALAMAWWARPARAEPHPMPHILGIVLSPAIALVALGLPLYAWAADSMPVAEARTVFTTFAVLCGLLLLPLLHPPLATGITGHRRERPDVRPTLLAMLMLAGYGLCFAIEPMRAFFELVPLQWSVLALIVGLSLVWAGCSVMLWHLDAGARLMALARRPRTASAEARATPQV